MKMRKVHLLTKQSNHQRLEEGQRLDIDNLVRTRLRVIMLWQVQKVKLSNIKLYIS